MAIYLVLGLLALLALAVLALLMHKQEPEPAYRVHCADCGFDEFGDDAENVRAAAIFHNMQTRESGKPHRVFFCTKGKR